MRPFRPLRFASRLLCISALSIDPPSSFSNTVVDMRWDTRNTIYWEKMHSEVSLINSRAANEMYLPLIYSLFFFSLSALPCGFTVYYVWSSSGFRHYFGSQKLIWMTCTVQSASTAVKSTHPRGQAKIRQTALAARDFGMRPQVRWPLIASQPADQTSQPPESIAAAPPSPSIVLRILSSSFSISPRLQSIIPK